MDVCVQPLLSERELALIGGGAGFALFGRIRALLDSFRGHSGLRTPLPSCSNGCEG